MNNRLLHINQTDKKSGDELSAYEFPIRNIVIQWPCILHLRNLCIKHKMLDILNVTFSQITVLYIAFLLCHYLLINKTLRLNVKHLGLSLHFFLGTKVIPMSLPYLLPSPTFLLLFPSSFLFHFPFCFLFSFSFFLSCFLSSFSFFFFFFDKIFYVPGM